MYSSWQSISLKRVPPGNRSMLSKKCNFPADRYKPKLNLQKRRIINENCKPNHVQRENSHAFKNIYLVHNIWYYQFPIIISKWYVKLQSLLCRHPYISVCINVNRLLISVSPLTSASLVAGSATALHYSIEKNIDVHWYFSNISYYSNTSGTAGVLVEALYK